MTLETSDAPVVDTYALSPTQEGMLFHGLSDDAIGVDLESSGGRSARGVVSVSVPGAEGALQRLAGDVGVSAEQVTLAAWVVVLAVYSGKSGVSVDVATDGAVARVDVDADPGVSFASLAALLSRSLDGPG